MTISAEGREKESSGNRWRMPARIHEMAILIYVIKLILWYGINLFLFQFTAGCESLYIQSLI